MVKVYQFAEIDNLMVVGAANRTELMTGTYSKWGVDHCADVMPIVHLYRSQLEELAKYLKIPEYIRNKSADPDVIPGVHDKGALLGDFSMVDQVLIGLETGMDKQTLYENFGKKNVERIEGLLRNSYHMRHSPVSLLNSDV